MTLDLATDFHDRLQRDPARGALQDGDIRYLMIRADGLMGLFARLDPALAETALAALAASVAKHGGASLAAYAASGAADPDRLLDTVVATSAQLGWGRWHFAPAADGLHLTVTGSPFAIAAADGPRCAAIRGMLTALAPHLGLAGAEIAETACAAVTGAACCEFRITP